MKTAINYSLLSLLACTLLVLGLSSCGQNKAATDGEAPAQKASSAVAVRVGQALSRPINQPVQVSGVLASQAQVKLSFKTGGIIDALKFDEGDVVRKDQVLATLNLREIEAQVAQANAAKAKADRDLQRVKNLYADSVATLEQLQNAETAVAVATANLTIAEYNLNYSTIKAPISGTILKRLAEPDELIGPGQPVFLLATTNQAWVLKVGVADKDLLRLNEGDRAEVVFDAYPGQPFTATLSQIAQVNSQIGGTYEVELQLAPTQNRLLTGLVARASISPNTADTLVTVPVEALTEADGKQGYVYAVSANGQSVKRLPVGIHSLLGDEVALSQGLNDGQQIVIDGVAYLTPGSAITIVE